MKRPSIAHIAILAAASSASPVRATLTFFDPFDYQVPDGTSLSGQTDLSITPNRQWFMAATAGTLDPKIIGGNLSYPGLAASTGNSVQLSGAGTSGQTFSRVDIGTNYIEPAVGQEPVNLYYSMVLKVTDITSIGTAATGSFFTGLQYKYPEATNQTADGLTSTEASSAGPLLIHAGTEAGTYNLGVAVRDAPNATRFFDTTNYDTTQTLFVVVKYVMGPGNKDDEAHLYINPTLSSEPAASTIASRSADISGEFDYTYNNSTGAKVVDNGGTGLPLTALRSLILRNNSVEPTHIQVDELRVGTSWADVVPTGLPHITGDTNGDGVVDLADLNNVLNNFGNTTPGNPGDDNHDNVVDLQDLNNVLNNFGSHAAAGALLSVPEPASIATCALAAMALAGGRRRRT